MNIDFDFTGKKKAERVRLRAGMPMNARPTESHSIRQPMIDYKSRLNAVSAAYNAAMKSVKELKAENERISAELASVKVEIEILKKENEKLVWKAQKPWKNKRHEVKREEPIADENVATEEV